MMIAAIHRRESDCDFDTYLGNGEPLDEVTTLVPAGRGPFDTWEEGAIDALTYDGLTEVTDWRLEKMLFHLEKYNGLGYHNKTPPLPSPYLWAGTNIQEPGSTSRTASLTPTHGTSNPVVVAYCTPSTGLTRRRSTSARQRQSLGFRTAQRLCRTWSLAASNRFPACARLPRAPAWCRSFLRSVAAVLRFSLPPPYSIAWPGVRCSNSVLAPTSKDERAEISRALRPASCKTVLRWRFAIKTPTQSH